MSVLEFNDALLKLERYLNLFAYNFTRNKHDARDLTQETLLRAMLYRSQYTPHTNFKAWVSTIMRNVFINQYRRKQTSGMIFDFSKDSYLLTNYEDCEHLIENNLIRRDIEQSLVLLDNDVKLPFLMHTEGFKYHEIAEKLQIPIGTVKSRIFLARKKLMQLLPEYNYLAN